MGLRFLPFLIAALAATSPARAAWTNVDSQKVDAEVQRMASVALAGRAASVAIRIRGKWVYEKHFGTATRNSLYDLASLTKVVATSSAALLAFQAGWISPTDAVENSLPEIYDCLWVADRLSGYVPPAGIPKWDPPDPALCSLKSKIQFDHLLRHRSGYADRVPVDSIAYAKQAGVDPFALFSGLALKTEPGGEFRYADISMIVLREALKAVLAPGGLDFDEWIKIEAFRRMGMLRTVPQPGIASLLQTYPKTVVVPSAAVLPPRQTHDPLANALGGVAGNAGYFSTLEDLMKFAEFWIERPTWISSTLFDQATTSPAGIPATEARGWGWDIGSSISDSARGPITGGFGHTGYTGTSIWIQPQHDFAIVILSNRTYPYDTAASSVAIQDLRRAIATIAWAKK